jgi:hypothetical protein
MLGRLLKLGLYGGLVFLVSSGVGAVRRGGIGAADSLVYP